MAEGLKKILSEDSARALKEGDKIKLSVLRLILSEIKNKEFEKRNTLQDNELYSILRSMSNRYRDAISKFRKGGRSDLVEKEENELRIVESYLPKQMSSEQVNNLIEEAIREVGASSMKDMGKVMKLAIEKASGRADNKVLSDIVRQKLTTGR